jgi:hypothetical protein
MTAVLIAVEAHAHDGCGGVVSSKKVRSKNNKERARTAFGKLVKSRDEGADAVNDVGAAPRGVPGSSPSAICRTHCTNQSP